MDKVTILQILHSLGSIIVILRIQSYKGVNLGEAQSKGYSTYCHKHCILLDTGQQPHFLKASSIRTTTEISVINKNPNQVWAEESSWEVLEEEI